MLPYLIVFSIILGLSLVTDRRNHRVFFWSSVLLLFVFAAFRGNGNGDYFAYKSYSGAITTLDKVFDSNFPMEIGFRVIAYVNNTLGLDRQFVIIALALLSVGTMSLFIAKMSKVPLLSLMIFFHIYLYLDMHHSRQGVATGFTCLSMYYFFYKKHLKCGIFLLLASCFHKSSLVVLAFLVAYQLLCKKKGIGMKLGITAMVLCTAIVQTTGFDIIVYNILSSLPFDYLSRKFYTYMNSEAYGYPFSLLDPRLLLLILCYVTMKWCVKKIDAPENEREINLYADIILASCLALIVFSEHTQLALRLSYYFSAIVVVAIPNFCYYLSQQKLLKKAGQVPWYAFSDVVLIGGYVVLNLALILKLSENAQYSLYVW